MPDSSVLTLGSPGVCHYCDSVNTRAILLPWKKCEGWWTCAACMDKAVAQMHAVMNKRRIVGTNVLPAWFRQRGTFVVQRSSGALSRMGVIDFACDFSRNEHNGDSTEGRVQLSNGHIFIDMFAENEETGEFSCKQVKLQNLYENNPDLLAGDFALDLPKWVDATARVEWDRAAARAVDAGKKKLEMEADPAADELTDVEDAAAPPPPPTPVEAAAPLETTVVGPTAVGATAVGPTAEDDDEPVAESIAIDEEEEVAAAATELPTPPPPPVGKAKPTLSAAPLAAQPPFTYSDADEYPPPPANPTFRFY